MASLLKYASDKFASISSTNVVEPHQCTALLNRSAALTSALAALSRESDFSPPKLVVVGTQSSGKSSLLNSLIGVQMLPTGETMTTRAAIQIQMVNVTTATRVEFGSFAHGEWVPGRAIPLNDPPTPEEHSAIQEYISSETGRLLNGTGGVLMHTPISLRLYSKSVPNMSFIDLPGLTMHALTSEGQPADMCEQIRELIRSYVDERTMVLMVCAARPDLEADAAVDLCMSMTGGKRTLGCLTKIDLCDAHSSIVSYIEGANASDLRVEHGYFAVRCRMQPNEPIGSVYAAESAFVRSVPAYRACPHQDRFGVLNVGTFVHSLILRSIEAYMPVLRHELVALRDTAASEYSDKLQFSIPDSEQDKRTLVNDLLARLVHHLNTVVTSRKPDASTGRVIREAFAELRDSLRRTRPFDDITDDEVMQAVRNCEGWSMVAPIPPIEIVEYFMQHKTHRPIQKLMAPCVKCVDNVQAKIASECKSICNEVFHRFSRLDHWVMEQFDRVQAQHAAETKEMVSRILTMEESYIFTDNHAFVTEWTSVTQHLTPQNYAGTLKTILTSYFTVVADAVASQVPKLVVFHVRTMLSTLQPALCKTLQSVNDVAYLLYETAEIEALRAELTRTMKTVDACIRAIDNSTLPEQ